jgi:hypothetical protein
MSEFDDVNAELEGRGFTRAHNPHGLRRGSLAGGSQSAWSEKVGHLGPGRDA